MRVPLVKWAGGKRQLLEKLNERLPKKWGTYFEPFVGGGALLVYLHNQRRINKAIISDLNGELINFYRVVKNDPEKLICELHNPIFKNNSVSFNEIKAEFNEIIGTKGSKVKRAACLLYLNKHGFNGLWRVNSKGKYNVPFGHHTRRSLPSDLAIMNFHKMLETVTIFNYDFKKAVKTARKGDFIYFDPPYHPISKTASFTDYNSNGFKFQDQERLANLFKSLSDKGVFVMLSNSRIQIIEDLYAGFNIKHVEAKRFINCNGERRSGIFEIIVTNY